MELTTKYFGTIDYEAEDCLSFPVGLFGFEEENSFLLLPFAGSGGNMLCLQSTATPALAFVVMDPFSLCPDYAPELTEQELRSLGADSSPELGYYVLCAVKDPVADSTVNLRCPVAVHPETLTARQVILETDTYEMRHPLRAFGRREEGSPC